MNVNPEKKNDFIDVLIAIGLLIVVVGALLAIEVAV
jgi:hypothetical protein